MRTARVVGLSQDGRSLIVATETGEELAIAADERLRAAVRGDRPRLGQLEIEMESSLTPRDIQTRIRAGETLEAVARVAGLPMDRVERFAAPVLAEREHIAAQAMSASVRRKGETSGHRSLRITVTERLLSRGVDIDQISWDSFRLDDGRWAVTADYHSGEAARHAEFLFDLRARFSVAGNEEARWLLGEHSTAKGPQPLRRRPAEHADAEDDDTEPTLDLNDELALVRATREPAVAEPARDEANEPTVALPRLRDEESAMNSLQGMLGGPGYGEDSPRVYAGLSDASAVPETPALADAEGGWEPAIVINYPVEPSQTDDPGGSDEPGHADGPDPADEPGVDADGAPTDQPGPPLPPANLSDRTDEEQEFELEHTAPITESKPAAKRKRASVPSWDEIMFGSPKPR